MQCRRGVSMRPAWGLLVCLLALELLLSGGHAVAADGFVTGKTKNGCSYDQLADYGLSKMINDRISEGIKLSFARQTWEGPCVNGRVHGVGTLREIATGSKDIKAETREGLFFLDGRHVWAPHVASNMESASALSKERAGFPYHRVVLTFENPDRLHLGNDYGAFAYFENTNPDGSIQAADTYLNKAWPSAYIADGIPMGGSTEERLYLRLTPSSCNGMPRCLMVGNGKRYISCRMDCREEWNELTTPIFFKLTAYLDVWMPKIVATGKSKNLDTSGVVALVSPLIARVGQLRSEQIQKVSQQRRPIESENLNQLIRRAMGGRK